MGVEEVSAEGWPRPTMEALDLIHTNTRQVVRYRIMCAKLQDFRKLHSATCCGIERRLEGFGYHVDGQELWAPECRLTQIQDAKYTGQSYAHACNLL